MDNSRFENDSLVDLLSECHQSMRKMLESTWNLHHEVPISNTEWYILSKVYNHDRIPLSEVTKHVSISRQAIHKQVKNLEAKNFLMVGNVKYNKKEKCLQLTEKGKNYYERYEQLKAELETKIASKIGKEEIILLKEILGKDWGMKSSS